MITAIIFDFFDVFRTDSYKAWLAKNNFERTGTFAEASILSDEGKITLEEFYRQISEAAGRMVTPQEVDESAKVNEEMIRFAKQLRTQYQTSLLSNAPGDFVRGLLDKHELNDIFDDIFISGETGLIKPHAEAFEHALSVMKVNPKEALFIDDNPTNVESAKQLGIHAIVFTSVEQLKTDLTQLGVGF